MISFISEIIQIPGVKKTNPLTSESLQVVVYYKRRFIALQNKEWRTILTS